MCKPLNESELRAAEVVWEQWCIAHRLSTFDEVAMLFRRILITGSDVDIRELLVRFMETNAKPKPVLYNGDTASCTRTITISND